jgi:mRNA-degrading endonuclease RelE of RelBE toxin-antitoxin system
MELHIKLENSCKERKPSCINCHNHFMAMRPLIKEVVVSKHFIKDLKDQDKINSIIQDVLDCSHSNFIELHKFEEHIDGNMVFRARQQKLHIVYCIDKNLRIIFLRAFKNFTQYKKFLDKKSGIRHLIAHEHY